MVLAVTLYVVNLLDDGIEHGVGVLAAAGSEAGGMGVTVDRGVVSQLVFLHDLAGITPEEEVGLDFLAERVATDTAPTGVAEKIWCDADFAASGDFVDVHGGLSFEVWGGVRRSLRSRVRFSSSSSPRSSGSFAVGSSFLPDSR
jgi:hypothetical protein